MINKHLSKILVNPEDSIKTVFKKLADNDSNLTSLPAGMVLIIEKNGKLAGIATDGDIRRALSGGASLESPIAKIMNRDPFVVEGGKSNAEILAFVSGQSHRENWHKNRLANRLNKIIIVDKEKRPVDLVSFYDLWHRSDVRLKQVGVLGLGYVGLTLALTLADLGFTVKGFDINAAVRESLKKGKPHFYENGIDQMLKDCLNKKFEVVSNFTGKNQCDIYFVAVGTPLGKNKKPDLKYLKNAAEKVGKALKSGDLVILRSTVPIGTTRNFVVPILEKTSSLKAGDGFLVAFAPERTIEGKALEELRSLPQVIGGFNKASVDLTAALFNNLTHSTVLVDSLEEAEVVKLVNNTYRDVTFSFANELALICHRFGIDTRRIIEAANRGYGRSNVPLPSPGVGGACLEKDPFIFAESAKTKNYEPLLPQNSRKISDLMVDFVAQNVVDFLREHKAAAKNPKVLVLGFAFKGRPVTSDMRGSTTVPLIRKIQKITKNIHGFDPAVKRSDIASLKVKPVSDLKKGFAGADAVVIMNNNPVFEDLSIRPLLSLANKPCFFFDTWGLHDKSEVTKVRHARYKRL